MTVPVLHLRAAPPGPGKSTFHAANLSQLGLPFVNADLIAAAKWPGDEVAHGRQASQEAARVREALLDARRSFVAETVFSHESKVELVRRAGRDGYLVHLHVLLVPAELSVARVALRVTEGGHDVPEATNRARNARLWRLIAQAIPDAYKTVVFDSSASRGPAAPAFVPVAQYRYGTPLYEPDWPDWTPIDLRQA